MPEKTRPDPWQGYARLLARTEIVFRQVRQEYPDLISCGLGCDDCCRAPFRVSLIEGVALSTALESLARGLKRRILNRAEKELEKALELFRSLPDQGNRESLELAARTLSRARLRCPLLTGDGCAVYPARPATCRLYGLPTQSGGLSHTCPRSGFEPGQSYPTVDLDLISDTLAELSLELAAEAGLGLLELAPVPVAQALLKEYPDRLRPPGRINARCPK